MVDYLISDYSVAFIIIYILFTAMCCIGVFINKKTQIKSTKRVFNLWNYFGYLGLHFKITKFLFR